MAEKPKKDEKKHHHSGGEMAFGLEVVLFVVAIFVIWILMGGAKKEQPQNMLIKPEPGQIVPSGN
jgi:hypothetical protein